MRTLVLIKEVHERYSWRYLQDFRRQPGNGRRMFELLVGRDNRRSTDCRDEHKNNAAKRSFVCKVDVSWVSLKRLFHFCGARFPRLEQNF